jgi:hypothetical protein
MLFHKIEGAVVILRQRGVFKQVDVYRREEKLYAKAAGGFIGLKREGGTTKPEISWEHLEGVKFATVGFDVVRTGAVSLKAVP